MERKVQCARASKQRDGKDIEHSVPLFCDLFCNLKQNYVQDFCTYYNCISHHLIFACVRAGNDDSPSLSVNKTPCYKGRVLEILMKYFVFIYLHWDFMLPEEV